MAGEPYSPSVRANTPCSVTPVLDSPRAIPPELSESPAHVDRTAGADALLYVLKATLIIGVVASLAFTALDVDGQVFAVAARLRHLVLTALYAITAIALVRLNPGRVVDERGRRVRWPLGRITVALPAVSFLLVTIVLADQVLLGESIQGAALVYGCFLAGWVGALARGLTPAQETEILRALIAVALLAASMDIVVAPLTALVAPAAGAAILLGRSNVRNRLLYTVAGFVILGVTILRLVTAPPWQPPSSAVIAQIGVTLVFLGVVALPSTTRVAVCAVGAAAAIALGVKAGALDLLLGRSTSTDITIMQRSYEADAVWQAVRTRATTTVFGLGPGGTVNLENAPDASTLVASGRDLRRVESVHLLPSYILLKFGLLGLVLFGTVCVQSTKVLLRHLTGASAARQAMVLFVVCGFVNALPAATFMFSNPLPALFLGYLSVARPQQRTIIPASAVP